MDSQRLSIASSCPPHKSILAFHRIDRRVSHLGGPVVVRSDPSGPMEKLPRPLDGDLNRHALQSQLLLAEQTTPTARPD